MSDGISVHDWAMEIKANAEKTMSIEEACEYVGVSRSTMMCWIAANKVGITRRMDKSVRVLPETLNWRLVPSAA